MRRKGSKRRKKRKQRKRKKRRRRGRRERGRKGGKREGERHELTVGIIVEVNINAESGTFQNGNSPSCLAF